MLSNEQRIANHRTANRNWYKNNKLAHTLRLHHNMSVSHYKAKLEAQSGRCAICGQISVKRLEVDHNHKTEQRRGLLCRVCNQTVALVENNNRPATLQITLYLTFYETMALVV